MAMIKVGTKAKVVIGIINTHFSVYPSNEAPLFTLRRAAPHQEHYFDCNTAAGAPGVMATSPHEWPPLRPG
ncbi:hypothetical protein NHX12_002014 [Muraenolepis orangiensis]|uniref:Uncharacterized protein n=1 Tax=Muraenolepis orangiensis TaxID=630683 RepID=A0A9Q0E3M6_9TELE|nr:hypothetical protein NHX12_002014 [Muraenolepis orangiensis]